MRHKPEEQEFQQQVEQIEALVRQIETMTDEGARGVVEALVRSMMDLNGAALRRILEIAGASGEPGRSIIERCAKDPLVSSQLLLHDIHPVAFESRVKQALDRVGTSLKSHGAAAELVSLEDGTIHVRVQPTGRGCSTPVVSLKQTVEEAMLELAPDMAGLTIDVEVGETAPVGFVALDTLRSRLPAAVQRG